MAKKLLILTLTLAVLWPPYSFGADPALMPLEEVERLIDLSPAKELNAYFESVERGTKIERYNIILRGVLREPGLIIILFVSTHSIAAGMSGSPVYLNGKKIGAVAYQVNNFNFNQYSWGGISPMSSMINDAEAGYQRPNLVRAFSYQGMLFESIALGFQSVKGLENFAGGKFMLTSQISQGVSSKTRKPVLRAGMPIVVDLVEWTDEKGETASISALGTITHIDNDGRIFAFGHPFLDAKKVVYGFRTAEIIGSPSSQNKSFKIGGKMSDVLGAITVDSSYGIYGSVASDELKRLRHFSLEFKSEGRFTHKFDIKAADSVMTPMLAQAAFGIIGQTYGAPLPQETSVTQIESRIDLEGQKPISWKGLFTSNSFKFGAQTLYASSYSSAYDAFFANIYGFLFENNYGLKISDVAVSVNFIPGISQVFKLGYTKFPNKVVYGQNPVLDVLFVDQDNIMPIAKKVSVAIDWSQVEKPIYNRETLDTQKTPEKTVNGVLRIEGAAFFFASLSNSERQRFLPDYFLGPEDFLKNLSSRLEITNQKIFVRVGLRARSGLFDEAIANSKDIMPSGISVEDQGWFVIKEGLKERKLTVKDEGMVVSYVNLPDIPTGYILDQRMREIFFFEVVLDK
ncbi:MAG: hypothetical protein Q8R55_03665 [Candidatus Taylorbacteria bacterium]|nr:hypothetical protein [Candidatus Taylorbacteria bacterium]